ncbi:MAG: SH3 domain-containing protein [Bacteroidota bacterium]
MEKSYNNLPICILALLLLSACGGESSVASVPEVASTDTLPAVPSERTQQEIVYAWVNNLNVREKPNTISKVVDQVNAKAPLVYRGERTDFTEEITLRGTTYNEVWIKVTTANDKTGWVYQGAVSENGEPRVLANGATIDVFGDDHSTTNLDTDSGCSCDFRAAEDNYKAGIFYTDMEGNGSIVINGQVEALTGGRVGKRDQYRDQSLQVDWITLRESGPVLLFGQEIDVNNYEENRDMLVQTLLVMREMPNDIPIQKVGQVGMGITGEFRSMVSEALEIAKSEKKKGNGGVPMEMKYSNARYDCFIQADVVGMTDSFGDKYAGTIEVKDKSGKLLAKRRLWGSCGC